MRVCFRIYMFSHSLVILITYFPTFLISFTLIYFNMFLWATFSFIRHHSLRRSPCRCLLVKTVFENTRWTRFPFKQRTLCSSSVYLVNSSSRFAAIFFNFLVSFEADNVITFFSLVFETALK